MVQTDDNLITCINIQYEIKLKKAANTMFFKLKINKLNIYIKIMFTKPHIGSLALNPFGAEFSQNNAGFLPLNQFWS